MGRLTYNPDTKPEAWQRYLRKHIGPAAPAMEAAISSASRILPVVTTAHAPSAANNSYWPELYFNQSMVDAAHYEPYGDTPAPRVFGNVSPLDPQLFSRINDFADELLNGEQGARYSPIEVAQWIEDYATAAAGSLAQAEALAADRDGAQYRRMAIDVSIQAGLGRFFAAKFRAGVLYRIHQQTGDRTALQEAVTAYRKARTAWAELAEHARGVYVADITVGELPQLRGHWLDRLPAIDNDIVTMAKQLDRARPGEPETRVRMAVEEALGRPHRVSPECRHTAPVRFRPGYPLEIELSIDTSTSVKLLYRHVNQAERFETLNMDAHGSRHRAAIPAAYTNSLFPLQYYFEVRESLKSASLYPGFAPQLNNQPYYVVTSTIP